MLPKPDALDAASLEEAQALEILIAGSSIVVAAGRLGIARRPIIVRGPTTVVGAARARQRRRGSGYRVVLTVPPAVVGVGITAWDLDGGGEPPLASSHLRKMVRIQEGLGL